MNLPRNLRYLYPQYFRNRRPFSRLRGTPGRQLNWVDTQLFGVAR